MQEKNQKIFFDLEVSAFELVAFTLAFRGTE